MSDTSTSISAVLELAHQLEEAGIHFEVTRYREDAISIFVTVPGERWEIDLFPDGSIGIEVFSSPGTMHGREKLEDLWTRFAEPKEKVEGP